MSLSGRQKLDFIKIRHTNNLWVLKIPRKAANKLEPFNSSEKAATETELISHR